MRGSQRLPRGSVGALQPPRLLLVSPNVVGRRAMVGVVPPSPPETLMDTFGQPILGEFGLPKVLDKSKTMSKAGAKARYMLQEEDFRYVASVRPDAKGPVVYTVAELEVAAMRRWGSEKEFKREQLRREIKRRRRDLRQRSSDQIALTVSSTVAKAVPFFGIESLSNIISSSIPTPLKRVSRTELYSGLPWDPALGVPPVDTAIVGSKAVYTAMATNAIMVVSKLGAFVVTGSASVLSETVHSIADLGNQCLLVVGINQSLKEPDAAHPYGYATERWGHSSFSVSSLLSSRCIYLRHPSPSSLLSSVFCLLVSRTWRRIFLSFSLRHVCLLISRDFLSGLWQMLVFTKIFFLF